MLISLNNTHKDVKQGEQTIKERNIKKQPKSSWEKMFYIATDTVTAAAAAQNMGTKNKTINDVNVLTSKKSETTQNKN